MEHELIYDSGKNVKVYRDGKKAIKHYYSIPYEYITETARLQILACNAGLPVPHIYEVRRISETETVLVSTYIESKPFISDDMDEGKTKNAVKEMAKLQSMIGSVDACELPKFSEHIAREIKKSHHIADDLKEKLLSLLSQLDTGKKNLCHGDIHPGNILFDGEKHWIIDWSCGSVSKGDPAADACNTYLYQKRFMPRYADLYLHSFCEMSNIRQESVLAWLPIIAAYQVNINDDEERAFIINIINDWNDNN